MNFLATIEAAYATYGAPIDETGFSEKLKHYLEDSETQLEARRVSTVFPVYSDEMIESVTVSLRNCFLSFSKDRDARRRAGCICFALREAKAIYGGVLPKIDDWERIYQETLRRA